MNNQLMQNTLLVLTNLEQLEKTVSLLYQIAAQQWPADADLWNNMAGDETKHSEYIKSLAGMLAKNPDNFNINRPINIVAINSSVSWINKNIADIKSGSFNNSKMFFLARDIEQSILESKYSEFLKTNDVEYNELVKLIIRETVVHKKMIDDRIANLKKG
jgi:hypothetical protein